MQANAEPQKETLPGPSSVAEALASVQKFADLFAETACEDFPVAISLARASHHAAIARIANWYANARAEHAAGTSTPVLATPIPAEDLAYVAYLLEVESDNTDNIIRSLRERQRRINSVLAWIQQERSSTSELAVRREPKPRAIAAVLQLQGPP